MGPMPLPRGLPPPEPLVDVPPPEPLVYVPLPPNPTTATPMDLEYYDSSSGQQT